MPWSGPSSATSAGPRQPRSARSPAPRRWAPPTPRRRLGGPRAAALGLRAGAAAMVAADARPQRRGHGDAGLLDGLVLGVAQAAALAPGVSRNGITLAAARWRHFSRDQANLLSRTIALP